MVLLDTFNQLKDIGVNVKMITKLKTELSKIKGIKNIVCRDNGVLEIYYTDGRHNITENVCRFINSKSLGNCFIRIDFIQIPKGDISC
jgi:hypothetical protein